MRVLAVAPGPAHHGVVRHGTTVARLVAELGVDVTVARSLDAASGAHDLTHVQFTDAIFGPDVAAAADAFVGWAATAPRPLVVTLHDVPGNDPDPARDARRRAAYHRVLTLTDAVVVSTEREATGADLVAGLAPVVVPLPVEPLLPPGPTPAWATRATIGVLGFVYPGKGHERALELAAGVGPDVSVVAAGGVSPGHEPLLDGLRRRADDLGVELLVTGPLAEADLHAAARAVRVPLAAYLTLGASASLATWLACGRRPIALDSAHARELARRWHDAVVVHDDHGLERAVADALSDPCQTWLASPPPRPDVAQAHLAVYRSVLARP